MCFSSRVVFCICFITTVISPATTRAQYKEIDHIGQELAKACTKSRPEDRIVAVADLQDLSGNNAAQGHYFSLFLTTAINDHLKEGYALAEHNGFDSTLEQNKISRKAFTSPDAVKEIAAKMRVDMIVIGDFRQEQNDYLLHVSAVRAVDGVAFYATDLKFRRTEFLDSLAKPFPPPGVGMPIDLTNPGAKAQVRNPTCDFCPVPQYTGLAREKKLQGTVVFDTLIDQEGKIVALRPRKVLSLGLTEAAFDVITKRWKMEAAKTKDGKPILVIVPIEVTFRLY
jgi:hypothetical protein